MRSIRIADPLPPLTPDNLGAAAADLPPHAHLPEGPKGPRGAACRWSTTVWSLECSRGGSDDEETISNPAGREPQPDCLSWNTLPSGSWPSQTLAPSNSHSRSTTALMTPPSLNFPLSKY